MFSNFDSTIHNLLGPKRPAVKRILKDKYGHNMSQANYEKAREAAEKHGYKTSPSSPKRIIVTPYVRKNPKADVKSTVGQTMAMRLHGTLPSEREAVVTDFKGLPDKILDQSMLFVDVTDPKTGRRTIKKESSWLKDILAK
jgi:hypothetical protein